MYKGNRKGLAFLEAVFVLVVAMAALAAMLVYVKRAYMGKVKEDAEGIGEQFNPTHYSANVSQRDVSDTSEITIRSGTTYQTINEQTTDLSVNETY